MFTETESPFMKAVDFLSKNVESQLKNMFTLVGIDVSDVNAQNVEEYKNKFHNDGYELLCDSKGPFDQTYLLKHLGKVLASFEVKMVDSSIVVTPVVLGGAQ